MFEFVRRQFTIGVFMPRPFGALAGVLACLQTGSPVDWGGAVAGGLAIRRLDVDRRRSRGAALRLASPAGLAARGRRASFLPEVHDRTAAASRFAVWCGPLVGLLQCWGLLRSLAGRHIEWRGIEYAIYPGGRMKIVTTTACTAAERTFPASCITSKR